MKLHMQINSGIIRSALIALVVWPLAASMIGCGNNGVIQEDAETHNKRLAAAGDLRKYYDKVNGNYDALSAEDKTAVDAITGGPEKTRIAFGHMYPKVGGPGAGGGPPAAGGPPPSGMPPAGAH
jgi:hypothetical protein